MPRVSPGLHETFVRSALLVAAALAFAGCTSPFPGEPPAIGRGITGGTETTDWPAIGVYLIDGGNAGMCTATLVQPGVALTASHCAEGAGENDLFVTCDVLWEAAVGDYHEVAETVMHPEYSGQAHNIHDVALLLLSDPIVDIEPIPVNTTPFDHTWNDRLLHYVGFGSNSVYGGGGGGVKRETDIELYEYYPEMYVHWSDYTNTCSGDSGGPGMVDLEGYWYVAGVNSTVFSGDNPDDACSGGGIAMRVDYELDFLAQYFDPYETPYPDPAGDDDDSADDGADDDSADEVGDDGCACRLAARPRSARATALVLAALGLVRRRWRRGA